MEEDAPRRSWLRFWCKFALYAAIFFAVILTTLSLLGGTSETLKAGVEQFFTRASGYPAHVETLNGLHFFPDFRLDMEGLGIADKAHGGALLVQLHSLKVAMGFWDMILHTGKMEALDLEGLRFAPGYLHPGAITAERLAIMHPDGGEPGLEGSGALSGTAWSARLALESKGRPGALTYYFGERRGFRARLGDLEMQGTLINEDGALVVEDFTLKQGGALLLRGRPVIGITEAQDVKLSGTLEIAGAGGAFKALSPDVTAQYKEGGLVLNGTIAAPVSAEFDSLRQKFQKLAGYPAADKGQPMLLWLPLHIHVTTGEPAPAP
jgi:hypothetical protein